jgi:hypothetical protein
MEAKPDDPKAGSPRLIDINRLVHTGFDLSLNTPEPPQALESRLRREEAEAEHKLRAQEAEDAHKRLITLIVHVFVMTIVAVAFLASVYIAVATDPKSGLPDKAMGVITAIVAAGVGYMTGKGSK